MMKYIHVSLLFLVCLSWAGCDEPQDSVSSSSNRDSIVPKKTADKMKSPLNPEFETSDQLIVKDLTLKELLKITSDLMVKLNIPKRRYLDLDNSIEVKINSTYPTVTCYFTSVNRATSGEFPNDMSIANQIYINPLIQLSPAVHATLFEGKDTTKLFKLNVQSIMIHELTHYYSGNPYNLPEDKTSELTYYSSPLEI